MHWLAAPTLVHEGHDQARRLRRRRDAIRCIVTMLTEDGGNGRSLLEELAAESGGADCADVDVDGTPLPCCMHLPGQRGTPRVNCRGDSR